MKAIVSNRIYLNKPPEGFDSIKKALTYKIEQKYTGSKQKQIPIEIIRNYKILPGDIISIPQGRFDLIPEGYEIIDRRVYNEMPFPSPKLALRPEQQYIVDQIEDSAMINALVGWGKTFAALHLARKLGQKTLVITHTTILRDQWIAEIQALYGMQAGIIGSGKYDIDHAIVVGNVQSLKKYTLELSKEFGTVILDECHHTTAPTFTEIVNASYARYRIGLSGTLVRRDGKHVLFKDYFGSNIFKPEQSNTLNPRIRIVHSGIGLKHGATWAEKINDLLYSEDYQNYISALATTQIQRGHKVLIVADRVEFLNKIKERLGETCMLVTGETGLEERTRIAEKLEKGEVTCIAGSRQIFSEGISINILSCLILASPIANEALLEQIVGRIMRKHTNKLDPLVLDIQFNGYADRRQNNIRLGFYLSKGWEVTT